MIFGHSYMTYHSIAFIIPLIGILTASSTVATAARVFHLYVPNDLERLFTPTSSERAPSNLRCLLLQCLQYLGTLELSAVGGDALLWMVRLRRDATLGNGGMDTDVSSNEKID